MAGSSFLFTSESVTEGHPDKVCDQISDGVLDEVLKQDIMGRVACESFVTVGLTIIGGEITEYTKLIAESREQCIDRMTEDARSKGANAIIMTRFTTSSLLSGAAELLSYGTAVIVEDE